MELESWDDAAAPVFQMDTMIAKSIHMTYLLPVFLMP